MRLLLVLLLVSSSTSQAPGDGDLLCQLPFFKNSSLPENAVLLMDSYDYRTLLTSDGLPSAWKALDIDNDSYTWKQASSDQPCRQAVTSCAFSFGRQDNWLVTQHINTSVNNTDLDHVVVRVEYGLKDCATNTSCQQSFIVHTYETSNVDSSASLNVSNYLSIDRFTFVLNPYGNASETRDVTIPLQKRGGLYLAIQDDGTCISISRLIVFYYICPQQTVDLVSFPRTAHSSSLVLVPLQCVSGALSEHLTPVAVCNSKGIWGALIGKCTCNASYYFTNQSCQACAPEMHNNSTEDGPCVPCPQKSHNDTNGSIQCRVAVSPFKEGAKCCTSSRSNTMLALIFSAIICILFFVVASVVMVFLRRCRKGKTSTEMGQIHSDPRAMQRIPPKLFMSMRQSYIDPRSYDSVSKALSSVAKELEPAAIRLVEEIGKGEFGTVFKGVCALKMPHFPIAAKVLKPDSSRKLQDDFLLEASIMGQFDHPYIVKLYGVITKSEPFMIVMEFMSNGSLQGYLRGAKQNLPLRTRLQMAIQVASGMQYLSDVGFVHRDLAARNVLVSKEEICKVGDFGLSRETIDDEYIVKKGGKIALRWTAPEALMFHKFTSASDVWSYGILLWEIMSNCQLPYNCDDDKSILKDLESGYRLAAPKDCPSDVYKIMLICWHADEKERPNFTNLIKEIKALISTKYNK